MFNRAYLAEFIGTFTLVFISAGAGQFQFVLDLHRRAHGGWSAGRTVLRPAVPEGVSLLLSHETYT